MAGYLTFLPTAELLIPEVLAGRAYGAIGAQYGVTRQAVEKRINTYCWKTWGMSFSKYKETLASATP